jgi:hypothetical protein
MNVRRRGRGRRGRSGHSEGMQTTEATSPPKAKRGVGRRRGQTPSAFEGSPSQRHADDDGHAERFTLLEGGIGGRTMWGGGRGRRKGGRV